PTAARAAHRRRRGSGTASHFPHEGGRHLRGAHGARHAPSGDVRRTRDDRHLRCDGGVRGVVVVASDLRHQREFVQMKASRAGFTLWELTMGLLLLTITAALAAPAIAPLGSEPPSVAPPRALRR